MEHASRACDSREDMTHWKDLTLASGVKREGQDPAMLTSILQPGAECCHSPTELGKWLLNQNLQATDSPARHALMSAGSDPEQRARVNQAEMNHKELI